MIAGLDDQLFFAAAIEPGVKHFGFNMEGFGKPLSVKGPALSGEKI